jgi:hypothetical protein
MPPPDYDRRGGAIATRIIIAPNTPFPIKIYLLSEWNSGVIVVPMNSNAMATRKKLRKTSLIAFSRRCCDSCESTGSS